MVERAQKAATLRLLLLLAWPVVVSRATQAVMGLADALMTAPLGMEALAASSTGAMNSFVLTLLPMGVVFVVQSFVAQLVGEGDLAAARRYAWYGLAVAAVAGAVALAAIPLVGPALALFDYGAGVHELMTSYLMIRLVAVVAVVGVEALGSWFGGLGDTRTPLVASLAAMAVDLPLNWILIYGKLGAPAFGVDGAALATTIGSFVGFGVLSWRFARAPSGRVRPLGLRVAELGRLLRFGWPSGVNWFFEFAAYALFLNVVVAHLGTTVLAAMNVVIQINALSFMPAFGLGSAGAILVGQAVGRGALDEVPGIVRLTARVALVWQGSVGLAYLAIPGLLMALFEPPGRGGLALAPVGATMLALSAAWQIFDALGLTFGEALRATGDTAWTMWARLAVSWLVFVPAGVVAVLILGHGAVAVMICLIAYVALLAIVLVARFRSGRWRAIDLTGTRVAT